MLPRKRPCFQRPAVDDALGADEGRTSPSGSDTT